MRKRWERSWAILLIVVMAFSTVYTPLGAKTVKAQEGWEFAAFGSNTGEEKNPPPEISEDGSVTIEAAGGKIASSEVGLSYYYLPLDSETNFEITTEAYVDSYSPDSQRAFGLMVSDGVGENGDSSKADANYAAVGALDDAVRGFYSQGGLDKLDVFSDSGLPTTGETYELSIKKSGDTFVLTSNGQSETVTLEDAFTDDLYVGLFVARDGKVTFKNTEVEQLEDNVEELVVDTDNMKTEYLIDEALDLEGLEVTAVLNDGSEHTLTADDYFVTGFDSSEAGTNSITVHYNGAAAGIDLTIRELQLTDMTIKYYPAKTDYYLLDTFDPEGLVVIGEYENGYQEEELTEEQYQLLLDGEELGEEPLDQAGTQTVTVQSTQSDVSTSFDIDVKDESVTKLEVTQLPQKTQYFIGDELSLDGLSVTATYSDGETERLTKGQLEVYGFDSSTEGDQEVSLSFKGETTSFTVNVKEKEVEGIQVTNYPQTTYQVGDELDLSQMEVSTVYDNGEKDLLSEDQYTIDDSAFDASQPGVYPLTISPVDDFLEAIELEVTVREAYEPEWKTIQFGQSTGDDTNYIEENDGTIRIVAEPGAGKITGDHDGITYYYTEINAEQDNFKLSADIKVNEYAKSPNHDGQESFGIMARDVIGENDNSSVFASNIAAIGGYSGGTQEQNGTQLFIRTGVESPDGAGSQGVQKIMLQDEKPGPDNTYPEQDYRLTLSKTNSGYTGQLNDGSEEIFFEPDILNVQDSKIYVGFYTARLADIEVSNIDFNISDQATDAPKVDPPQEPVSPEFSVESRSQTSEADYDLLIKSNVDGMAAVKQGSEIIADDLSVKKGELTSLETQLESGANNFSLTFYPDDTQYLTSYDKQVKNFTVNLKAYAEGGNIHVSPSGTSDGDGTKDQPLDLDTAIEYVLPGQKIVLAEGDYVRSSSLAIDKYNDGYEDQYKYLVAEDGSRPVIDFDKKSEGVVLSGDYWHIKGIDFARSAGNTKGFTIGGDHNIVELSRFYENGDTGLQISRTDAEEPKEDWPSHNLILNSESFDNRDPSDNNADGFAAKLTSGEGNIFRGCIAHHNIDDGWDLYTKAGTGAIGPVLIEDSIAYENGSLTDGTVGDGDKNGFKLGGEGIHVPHVLKNSLAFYNGADGITSNSNPGVIAENNTAYNNEGRNVSLTTYSNIEEDFTVDGLISYQTAADSPDQYPEENESEDNFFFNGTDSVNKSGTKLTEENFVSLDPDLPFERDEEGNIITGDFLQLQVTADVEVTPETLKKKNYKKNGPKVKAYVTLQDGYSVEDIDGDTIRLNHSVEALSSAVDDYDEDGELEYLVEFSRHEVVEQLEKGEQQVSLSGQLKSGFPFKATTTVQVK
ncbi:bacterial Ig-like domain-containing protein [Halobacillus sp. Marseille-Q1614]|uniref:bacterial Ig-like domain-containing protein n=1 Tax=Halobacillus sp. Marseille-Q1614 TaxID=2709134 RepID=UPI00156FD809|nr:bacterial Ig-like domain-containing protein [Halobacillus sp. Marseille-Q1614]